MIRTIGDIIRDMQFPSEEKDRIRSLLLDANSIQRYILVNKALLINRQAFWKKAAKLSNVTGFRSTSDKIRQYILNKVVSTLSANSTQKNEELTWLLYKQCIIEYVGKDLANLNNLLLEEKIDEKQDNLTHNIFLTIVKHASQYKVTNEDILNLYELWGFPRINNIKEIVGNLPNESSNKAIKLQDCVFYSERSSLPI